MKHVEMIIEYTTDGTDYQYHDNRGVLIRCKDCKYFDAQMEWCDLHRGKWFDRDYYIYSERREE